MIGKVRRMSMKAKADLFQNIKHDDFTDEQKEKKMGICLFKETNIACKSGADACHKITDLLVDADDDWPQGKSQEYYDQFVNVKKGK